MFRLAHVSDLHLGPLPPVSARELASKRITGYINWKRNRSMPDQPPVVESLVQYLATLEPDHTAITGDLVNLGLDAEIANARLWLGHLGSPHDFTVVCGNHDAYVQGALKKAFREWQPWLCGDDGRTVASDGDYPVVRRRDGVSILACNSAIATAPFMATGQFGPGQASRLAEILKAEAGNFRCVLIHHAAFRGATRWQKRLKGLRHFLEAIRKSGAELVLHGHTHYWTMERIPGPGASMVPVCCVPAAYQWPGDRKPPAGINLFRIGGNAGRTGLVLERHGLAAPGAGPGQFGLIGEFEL